MPPPLPRSLRLLRSAAKALPLALLTVSFTVQAAAAVVPHLLLLTVATAGVLASEAALLRWLPGQVALLAKVRADTMARRLTCDFLLLVGMVRMPGDQSEAVYLPLVLGLLLCYALHFAAHAAAIRVRQSRTLPLLTRNIDASALRITPAPPALLTRSHGPRVLLSGLPATTGLLLTAASDRPVYAAAGITVSAALAALAPAVLGWWLVRRRPAGPDEVQEWFDAWLADYRPTVGMYFSGGSSSAYQANMWLDALAALGERPVVVLRERFMMQRIGATDLPVVCLPKVAQLLRLEHSTLKVLIHPANSGKTSQVLRIPTIKHAFVNHGESDKLSSCNPYAKAYDEVWVAGPAARERYALADVGVRDADVVEIGRPQLAPIAPYAGPPAGPYTTVLYAPTWEGWDGNPGNTSVVLAGENIVRHLLADPGVRLLYKPHPMTGSVDPRAGAADARIQELIHAANRARPGPRPAPEAAEEPGAHRPEFRPDADDAERMLAQGTPPAGRAAALAAATAEREAAHWAALPAGEHRIVTGAEPSLYSCFNAADLLISDVSSVVSDFLAGEKPYAVANTSGLADAVFRETFPTVSAATVLTPDAAGVPALLAAVRAPGGDGLAETRAALKLRLLGPSDPPSAVRFGNAARALCEAADAHRVRVEERLLSGIPAQRRTDAAQPAREA
ncbi:MULTISPECIES: hypothetical protein [unclassified Streptomyces]|uniref:hypothetical protein n=1 Tax=unclassified Streptomyces TaxID=2593676 RepID=UPI0003675D91|nr:MULTISPECIES: hypothetical protein [unclassified Streptomyces]MYQ79104.1 hypothetical protein [Streptomyces sp. SID4923]